MRMFPVPLYLRNIFLFDVAFAYSQEFVSFSGETLNLDFHAMLQLLRLRTLRDRLNEFFIVR